MAFQRDEPGFESWEKNPPLSLDVTLKSDQNSLEHDPECNHIKYHVTKKHLQGLDGPQVRIFFTGEEEGCPLYS